MNKKMMNLGISLWLACVAGLMATSCTDDTDDGATLPPGTCPLAFTASVDGLTATRTTTDNSWAGGENVAIQIGSEVKKYTAASGGKLTVAGDGTPFYWQSTANITVNAWYPYCATKPTDAELKVKANQGEGNNYQSSDYLEAVDVSVAFNNPILTFKHRTAKVVVTLQAGEGVTDLTGAAVIFVNQIGVESGTEVTSKTETTNGVTTYSALLFPQNMQGKQFIKVALGGNSYYYTPKGVENGNLQAGYVDNYTITVKQNGLSVVWQKGEQIDDTAEKASSFNVYLAEFTAPQNTSYKVTDADGKELKATDGVYTLVGNELNISLTVDEGYLLGFFTDITGGIGKRKKALANNTYTYTFYDIRSDLWLSSVQATITSSPYADVSVGDFFYSDGTCSSILDNNKTCIGIVFKVGVGQGDKIDNYYSFLAGNVIHGYVVALKNANSEEPLQWSTANVVTGVSTSQENFDGYSNTLILKEKENSKNNFPAVWACINNNSVAAPVSSSSWYLPSYAQMKELSDQESNIQTNLVAAGGSIIKPWGNPDYWTSSEDNNTNVWHFSGYEGGTFWTDHPKTNKDRVRAILTF